MKLLVIALELIIVAAFVPIVIVLTLIDYALSVKRDCDFLGQ